MKTVLAVTYPELAAEWHYEKNSDLTPEHVATGSHIKVWWKCRVEPTHEWQAVIRKRVRGNGCPMCKGRVATPTSSLKALHPSLAEEWHLLKNEMLTPDQVRPGSGKKVWWQCRNNPSHEWQATVVDRVAGTGCPVCRIPVGTFKQSLLETHPQLASEWHSTKNNGLTPHAVGRGSNKKVWWQCRVDPSHEWLAHIPSRVRGHGCPVCSGLKAVSTTSLKALHPTIAAEWHPTKNGELAPENVKPKSNKKVWWHCDAEHEWEAVIQLRVNGSGKCPICSGRFVTSLNSLQTLYPELSKEWHPTKNGSLTPAEVKPGKSEKAWWRCRKDSTHEWQASINSRVRGNGCPICRHLIATPETSLMTLYPELSSEWHPEKNESIAPNQVVPGSSKKVWWKCYKDEAHEWQASINSRVRGNGCPICANKVVSATTSLCQLYPHIAADWHPTKNGALTPEQVVPGSGKKVWWICSRDSSHEWETAVVNRVNGSGCLICGGKVVTNSTSLYALYPQLAKEWHLTKNNGLTSHDVLPGSHRRVWWQCQVDPTHEWQAIIANRSLGKGTCPLCVSLLTLHPQLAQEWHPTKNGALTPDQVKPGSNQNVWWRCQVDPAHEWQVVVYERVKGRGCPVCSGYRVTTANSLQSLYPQLAQEWHLTKNGALTPDQVKPGSNQNVWWQCSNDSTHVWQAKIGARAKRGYGCQKCSGRVPTPTTSLQALYPQLAREWHPTKNGTLTPNDVVPGSGTKVL